LGVISFFFDAACFVAFFTGIVIIIFLSQKL